MARYTFLAFTLVVLFAACGKQKLSTSQVIHGLYISNRTPVADGTTILDISATIDSTADADKRGVIFSVSSGMFLVVKDTVVTQVAAFENGKLIAHVKLQMPFVPGLLKIRARTATQNQYQNYQVTDSIPLFPSSPAVLKLVPSLLGIKPGLANEISLTGTLKNIINNPVSTGIKVRFDQYGANGAPVSGLFRIQRDTTDNTSTVTASYTAGTTSVGTVIYLKCTYIDPYGNLSTDVIDSCAITVTN